MPDVPEEWVAVRIELPEAAADVVANFLFEQGVAALVDDAHGGPGPRAQEQRRMEAHLPAARAPMLVASLREYALALAALDAALGPVRVDTAAVPPTDWEAMFRAHHRPTAIGARLLIAPPWDVPEAPGRDVIVVEPGLAFGTGQHPTTRTCLEELEEAIRTGTVRSVLDVGTGSGILAVAATHLGVPRVIAVDIDSSALPVARATLARNGVDRVLIVAGGAAAVRGRYDLVLANLLAETLIAEASVLMARTHARGAVIASGILDGQVDAVAAAFAPWRVRRTRGDGPWRTVRLEPPG